ncbi:MAG TPA: LacI family transcriptional regulator [Candidatus Mediterraneibacter merdavium]|nr:LacI family transcriptional regulator [Candidatus Mediterraneibacter merdavium]
MANMKDVAKRAQVSVSTVSHVINGTRFVSEEVQRRVKDAMDAVGYIPNVVAHSLRTKKTNTIGLVIPIGNDENSNIFIMQVVLGIDSVLRDRGYCALLANTKDELQREIEEIRRMITRQIDGLILIPSVGAHDFIPELLKEKKYVFVDRIPQGFEDRDYVVSDSFGGSYEAVDELIKRGHSKIGILCDIFGKYRNSDERLLGAQKAYQDHGIEWKPEYICECASNMEEAQEKTKWLLNHTDVTAILAVSNIMGMGVVKYLKEADIRIPEDISLTIFDDYAWTSIHTPTITTIRQDAFEMGRQSAKLLLEKLEFKEEGQIWKPRGIRLPTSLIIRESWK